MASVSTAFTQTVPNLDPSEALQYPTIDGDVSVPISPSTTPIKSYAILPTPTWGRTSAFTIQSTIQTNPSALPLYSVTIQRGWRTTSIHILRPHAIDAEADKPTLATCRLKGFANKKYFFLGPYPDCTDLADWIPITPSSKLDPSKHRFSCHGEEYSWTRTHKAELGASRWDGKSFKLVRMSDGGHGGRGGDVLAVYVHKMQWRKRDEGRLDWFCEVDGDLEVLALAAVMGVEEEIRRQE